MLDLIYASMCAPARVELHDVDEVVRRELRSSMQQIYLHMNIHLQTTNDEMIFAILSFLSHLHTPLFLSTHYTSTHTATAFHPSFSLSSSTHTVHAHNPQTC